MPWTEFVGVRGMASSGLVDPDPNRIQVGRADTLNRGDIAFVQSSVCGWANPCHQRRRACSRISPAPFWQSMTFTKALAGRVPKPALLSGG